MPLTSSHLDELIRELVLYRGFSQTFKNFESELKSEKEKGFRVDKIIELIMSHVTNHDLSGLKDVWSQLQTKIFSRLEPHLLQSVSKLESGLLKLYLVNCIQTRRPDKVREFFERMTPDLMNNSEWKDWFSLSFVGNAESNPLFSTHFSRTWQDNFMLSLYNFFSVIFMALPPPRVSGYQSTMVKIQKLKEENQNLRQKLFDLNSMMNRTAGLGLSDIRYPDVMPPDEVIDDFCTIAQEAPACEGQAKSLKSFLKNITGVSASNPTIEKKIQSSSARATSTSLKQSKSRSSSKSRLSSTPAAAAPAQPQSTHAPVSRLSLSRPTSSSSLLSQTRTSPLGDKVVSEKKSYLLLSQEEYLEHNAEVTHCKFSSSGYVIASSDTSGVIKVWSSSPSNPETRATFISQVEVTALDWIPLSDRHFVYGNKSGIIRLCDIQDRKANVELNEGENSCIHTLTCSPNSALLAASAFKNGKESLLIYDMKTMIAENDLLMSLPSAPLLTSCVFNHNSQLVVTSGVDGKVRIFDLRKQDCISSWQVSDTEPILNLALSVDETSVFALTASGSFSGWSMYQSGHNFFEMQIDDHYFNSQLYPRSSCGHTIMSFAGDGKHMLTCSTSGGIIYEFNHDSMEKILGLRGHRTYATCTDWSSASNCGPCVTASKDGHIKVSTLLSQ